MERVAASSIEQDYDREEMVAPALNRRNTPGLNSYLKVVLDDSALTRLHEMTDIIKKQAENDIRRNADPDSGTRKKPLRIRPRSLGHDLLFRR